MIEQMQKTPLGYMVYVQFAVGGISRCRQWTREDFETLKNLVKQKVSLENMVKAMPGRERGMISTYASKFRKELQQ